jgi:hypothetical protein
MLSAFKDFCLVSDDRREVKSTRTVYKDYLNRSRNCQTYIPKTVMQQANKQASRQESKQRNKQTNQITNKQHVKEAFLTS